MNIRKVLRLILTASVASLIVAVLIFTKNKDEVIIISHRGSPIDFPEHTFEGYDDAIEKGSKFIEQDLAITKDGELIVSHDKNLKRLLKQDVNINEIDLKKIRNYKFENGESLHTLEEVFDKYGKNINYVVETKTQDNSNFEMENKLIDLVQNKKLDRKIVFQSFDLESLLYLKKYFPENKFMLLADNLNVIKKLDVKGVDIICLYYKEMNSEIIDEIHEMGKKAYSYTIDDENIMSDLVAAGLDGFFTNYTDLGLQYSK